MANETFTVNQTTNIWIDTDLDGVIDPGETVVTTVVITNNSTTPTPVDATGVSFTETLAGMTIVDQTGNDVNVSPIAFDDAYTAVGNTLLEVGNATAQTGPQASAAGSVIANDIEFFGDTFVISAFDATSANGGTISMVTTGGDAGSFTYVSDAGFTGTDTFTYTITDKGLDGVVGGGDDLTSVGTVTITVTGTVWYVDSAAAGPGDGTSTNPFNTITAGNLNGAGGAGDADSAGDYIYIKGTPTGPLALENNQHVIGTGDALVVNSITLAADTGTNSTLSAPSGTTLTLASGNEVAGINVTNANGSAVTGISGGTLTFHDVNLTSTTGQALALTGGTFTATGSNSLTATNARALDANNITLGDAGVTFQTVNSSGGDYGLVVQTFSQTATSTGLDVLGGTISGATTNAVRIDLTSADVAIAASLSDTAAGRTVSVTNSGSAAAGGNQIVFSGAIDENGLGILLDNNDANNGATVSFTGGLDINSTTNTGFTATNGGTVNVTGASNFIDTTTGQIINMDGVNVGASGVTFATLTSTGTVANTAINLNNVDGSGNTFNGGAVTIAATSGATSDGIFIGGGSSAAFSFSNALIGAGGGTGDDGIDIDGANNGNVTFTTLDNIRGNVGSGVEISGNTGTVNISGGFIGSSNDAQDNAVDIAGGSADITITSAIFKNTAGGDAVEITGRTAGTVTLSGNLNVGGTTGGGIDVDSNTGGTIIFSGATKTLSTGANSAVDLTNNTGTIINFTGGGLDIDTTSGAGFNATGGGTVSVTGSGNTITSTTGIALNVAGGTTIGASGLTFQSISANGAASGIVLNGTGSNGLTVTGTDGADGNSDPDAGTGGTIQSTTGAGVSLTNASNVSLGGMNITNTGGTGIAMSGGSNLTLTTMNNSGAGDGDNEHGLSLLNVGGTLSVQNSTIADATEDLINVDNTNTNLTLNIGTVTGNTFTQGALETDLNAFSGNGILVVGHGTTNYNLNVEDSTFNNIKLAAIQLSGDGGWTGTNTNVTLDNNDMLVTIAGGNSIGNANNRADYINIQSRGSVDIDAAITNNTLNGGGGGGIQLGADESSNLSANITGNVISNQFADGILMAVDESASLTVLIDNNQISNTSSDGMEIANAIFSDGLAATLNATITNNTVTNSNTNVGLNAFIGGIAVFGGADAADNTNLDIRNNSVSGTNTASYFDYYIDGSFAGDPIAVEGIGAGAVDEAAFLAPGDGTNNLNNTAGPPAGAETFITGAFFNGNVNVPLPVLTPLEAAPGGVEAAAPADTTPVADATPPADSAPPADTTPPQDTASGPGDQTPATPPAPPAPPVVAAHPVIVDDGTLSQSELDYFVDAAILRWTASGLTDEQVAALDALTFSVGDLAGQNLGAFDNGVITLDSDAAERGWYLDGTPFEDSEFGNVYSATRAQTDPTAAPAGHFDLLTTVMHEMGHALGLGDSYDSADRDDLMYGWLFAGERRLAANGEADGAVAGSITGELFAGSLIQVTPADATGGVFTLPAGKSVTIQWHATIDAQTNGLIVNPQNTGTVSATNAVGFPDQNTNTVTTTLDTLILNGTVFNDANGNSVFGGGEVGVDGVVVTLYHNDGTDAANFDASDTPVLNGVNPYTSTTSGGGNYSFTGLAPGEYLVVIEQVNFDTGGALEFLQISSPGFPDPDDNVDNDDNGARGVAIVGDPAYTRPITLDYNTEPTAGTGNDTNTTLDLGFLNNPPPVINDLGGDAATFTEGDPAVLLDDSSLPEVAATVTDDQTNLNGGNLTVSTTVNEVAGEDVLGISTAGTVTLSSGTSVGSVVSVGGNAIGTISANGTGGNDLVITLDTNDATPANIGLLIQALTYFNSNTGNPSTLARTIAVSVNDGLGGTDSENVTVNVTGVNDAPSVTAATLAAVNEDTAAPAGQSVDTIFTGHFTDPDNGAATITGIAVSSNAANALTEGAWQYSTDAGATWFDIGAVADATALALSAATLIRFVPVADFNGSPAALSAYGLDSSYAGGFTSGVTRTEIDAGDPNNGGTTAISDTATTVSTSITAVNDAPVLNAAATPVLATEIEDPGAPGVGSGTLISALVDLNPPAGGNDNVTDVDASPLTGIALTGVNTANGAWLYSIDGGANWNPVGAVTDDSARLLAADANTRLFFAPNANFNGAVSNAITFRAWDRSTGTNGGTADPTPAGGTTAFSATSDTANIAIDAVNDVPQLAGFGDATAMVENGAGVVLDANANASIIDLDLDASVSNYEGATLTMARNGGANPDDTFAGTGSLDLTNSNGLGENVSLDGGGTFIGTFNQPGDGTFTITFNASATAADVESVMRQIVYANAGDNPPASLQIDFTFSDGNGQPGGQAQGTGATPGTATGSFTVNITQVDDAPVLLNVALTAAYTLGSPGVVLSSGLQVFDADATPPSPLTGLANATIKIESGFFAGDALFVDLPTSGGFFVVDDGSGPATTNISVLSNVAGTLILSGNDTVTRYRLILDAVSYHSTAADPSNGGANPTRNISWQVNDGLLNSQTPSPSPLVNETVLHFNAPPTLDLDASGAGTGFTTTFTERDAPIPIVDTDISITDPDNTTIFSAKIVLTNAKPSDALAIVGALPGGIDSSIDTSVPGQITINLFNPASLAEYQTALGQIRFSNSSPVPDTTDRDIAVTVNDNNATSNVAHATVQVVDLPSKTADFNADGVSDVLLGQKSSGFVAEWLMNDGQIAQNLGVATLQTDFQDGSQGAPKWRFQDTGDFNADGKTDILWRYDDGQVVLWTMDGSQITNNQSVGFISTDWHNEGAGDFNGDGRADVLWHNDNGQVALWTMDGAQITGNQLVATVGGSWHFQGLLDADGDGKSDVLLRDNSGQVVLWTMNGAQIANNQSVANLGLDWNIQGTGDFNGDGRDDVILRNDSGQVVIWQMNGAQIEANTSVATPGNDWHLEDTGDYNLDGSSDVLWRNDSGQVVIWEMNGATIADNHAVASLGSDWAILNHRYDLL